MKKLTGLVFGLFMAGILTACGNENPSQADRQEATQNEDSIEDAESAGTEEVPDGGSADQQGNGNTLVAYFAYSENMGDTSGMEVDAITSASLNDSTNNTEGNLQVMAQIIEEETGADVFHILMEEPYDPDYSTMLPVAADQMQNEDWPALQQKIENLDEYDTVYIGTPVWNSVLPPAMMTFFEENDLSGKTVIPFGIHLGSRFGRMIEQIKELEPEAEVLDGFTVNAGADNEEVKGQFREWLEGQN